MNINEGFETPEESFARRSSEREACVDGVEALDTDIQEVERFATEAEQLTALLERIDADGAFSRGYAVEADALTHGDFGRQYPMGLFTTVPSKTMYRQANEGILSSVGKAIMAGLKALGELIMKLVNWVKSFFTKENKEDMEASANAAAAAEKAAKDAGMNKADNFADYMETAMSQAKKDMDDIIKMQEQFDRVHKEIDDTLKENDAQIAKMKEQSDAINEKLKKSGAAIDELKPTDGSAHSKPKEPLEPMHAQRGIEDIRKEVEKQRKRMEQFNAALNDVLDGKTPGETNPGINSLMNMLEFPRTFPVFYRLATDAEAFKTFQWLLNEISGPLFATHTRMLSEAGDYLSKIAAEWVKDQGNTSDPMVEDSLAAFTAARKNIRKTGAYTGLGTDYKLSTNLQKLIKLMILTPGPGDNQIQKQKDDLWQATRDINVLLHDDREVRLPSPHVAFKDLYRAAIRLEVNDLCSAMKKIAANKSIEESAEKLNNLFGKIQTDIEAVYDSDVPDDNPYHEVITFIRDFALFVKSNAFHQMRAASIAEKFLDGYTSFQSRMATTIEHLIKTDSTKKFKEDMQKIRKEVHRAKW